MALPTLGRFREVFAGVDSAELDLGLTHQNEELSFSGILSARATKRALSKHPTLTVDKCLAAVKAWWEVRAC